MKFMMALPVALGVFASSFSASAAPQAPESDLICAFGVPGFIVDDPEALALVLALKIPFVPGTSKLGTTATAEADGEKEVTIKSLIPTGEERYKFITTMGDAEFKVTVSTRQFKGKFFGAAESDLKETMAATATLPFANDATGALPVLNGFCVKSN